MKLVFLSLFIFMSIGLSAQHSYHCKHGTLPSYKSLQSDTIDILHYSIHLDIVYLSKKSIAGHTNLKVNPKFNNVTNFRFDLLHMNIDSVIIDGNVVTYQYNDTLLDVILNQSVGILDTALVSVYYHGIPVKDPSGWGGFYFTNDSTFAFNLGVGMQDNPHNYGRIWYPCLDDFIDRATYDFNIRVKSQNQAICNGTLATILNHTDGTKTYRWELHNDIPTYLSSVAVGQYVAYEDTFQGINGPIPIAIYARQSDMNNVAASFIHLKDILLAYETYFGPYRWERVGYVGVPFSSGAMEHATNIALGLGYMNGSLSYETLIAHELSHHWFGDLVTCSSAEDMWLNEGWAVFSESMYQEMLYGREAYKDNMRTLLSYVIRSAHNDDNGYRAVAGVPHEYTYGTTVYDKGGTVAHSIRGYLGDSLFFPMVRAYMSQFAYNDASSLDFRDFITSNTGVNMNDFFAAWVFEPGFTHFRVDSMSVMPMSSPNYNVDVYIQQKLLHKPNLANSNRVRIRFMDAQWNTHDEVIEFSGANGHQNFIIPINPIAVFTDPDEELADATIDYTEVITAIGTYTYPLALAKLNAQTVLDSALIQLTHHWVGPDTDHNLPLGLTISSNRFWSVDGIIPMNMVIEGMFQYSKSAYDSDVIKTSSDSIVILYRPYGKANWESVPFTRVGTWVAGQLYVPSLKQGDYVLAKWDPMYAGINTNANEDIDFILTPNPARDQVSVSYAIGGDKTLSIMDAKGSEIKLISLSKDTNQVLVNVSDLASGIYFCELRGIDGKLLSRKKLVVSP